MKTRVLFGMLIAGKDLSALLEANTALIASLLQEMGRRELEHTRYVHGLVGQFRDAMERDDHETLRNVLDLAIRDLADTVARMEEYSA